jgi:hypothetical protein
MLSLEATAQNRKRPARRRQRSGWQLGRQARREERQGRKR